MINEILPMASEIFTCKSSEVDYPDAIETFYFYDTVLKIKIGNNDIGSKFDQIIIDLSNSSMYLENLEPQISENFKIKLVVVDE